MQAKKRAKAVKFGKKIDKPEPKAEHETKPHHKEEKKEETPPEPSPHTTHYAPEEPKIEEPKIKEAIQEPTPEEPVKESPKETTPEEPQTPPEEIQNNDHQPHEEPLLNSTANETPTLTEDKNEINETSEKIEESPIIETQTIHHSSSKGGYFMLIAIISFVIGLLAMAGINFYMQKMQDTKNQEIAMKASLTPKPSPTTAPTPTPEVIDLTQYNIKILNGSGITGAASKLKASLTEEGFTVTSTGNASNNDYANTTISAKKDTNPKYLEKLKSFIGESYSLAATDSAETPDQPTGTTDVTIIIGSK